MHLSNQSLLVIIIVGIVAGWLAGRVVRGAGFGILGDLLSANRRLIERVLLRVRRVELALAEDRHELEPDEVLEPSPER